MRKIVFSFLSVLLQSLTCLTRVSIKYNFSHDTISYFTYDKLALEDVGRTLLGIDQQFNGIGQPCRPIIIRHRTAVLPK